MNISSYFCIRTFTKVFFLSKSPVSNAFVKLTDDVNRDAPHTMERFDAFIKLCSLFASTLQVKYRKTNE